MSDKLEIICDGDSWVFGCEIVDPVLAAKYGKDTYAGVYDYLPANDEYRLPRIFPTHLETLMNANVTNLAYPADDNGTILNRTITFITDEYLAKKKSTENLFVIVGWSSPERNVFWYEDEKIQMRFRLWPQVEHFVRKPQEDIWKLYVSHLWHANEYMPRYVMNVLQLQNFLNAHNISWMCFNSFYQTPNVDITEWQDLNVQEELIHTVPGGYEYHTLGSTERKSSWYKYLNLWNTIDPVRFYRKDKPESTFKSFIEKAKPDPVFNGWHPSPESHEVWAKELVRYIKEHNLVRKAVKRKLL